MSKIIRFGAVALIVALIVRVCFTILEPSYKTYTIPQSDGTTAEYTVKYYGDIKLSFYELLHYQLNGVDDVNELATSAINWIMEFDSNEAIDTVVDVVEDVKGWIKNGNDKTIDRFASAFLTGFVSEYVQFFKPLVIALISITKIVLSIVILLLQGLASVVVVFQNILTFIFGKNINYIQGTHGGGGRYF